MPAHPHCSPSLQSLALSHRKVPFVLPRRHSGADKSLPHSASSELLSRLRIPTKFLIMEVVPEDNQHEWGTTISTPPSRPKASPRRCNSDPDSCTINHPSDAGVQASSKSPRRQPRRCNSEPQESPREVHEACLSDEDSPRPSPSILRKKFSQRTSSIKSEPCAAAASSLKNCDVLQAYQEAVDFQEKLREDYETSKHVFILFRYRRLRSLIRDATLEQHLQHLRQAVRGKCSCGGQPKVGGGGGEEERDGCLARVEGMVEEVLGVMRPALSRIKTCLQSSLQFIAPSLLTSSTPSLHSFAASCTSSSLLQHEWQRSRLVLMERHLERLKRECLVSQRCKLPLIRYKAMKISLKKVLDARMV